MLIFVVSGTLLALVPTLNSADKVKLSSTDTGSTADSVVEAGYLPAGFNLANSYQQNYAFYIQRIDAGTLGVADPADRLVGLLITKDGQHSYERQARRHLLLIRWHSGRLHLSARPHRLYEYRDHRTRH